MSFANEHKRGYRRLGVVLVIPLAVAAVVVVVSSLRYTPDDETASPASPAATAGPAATAIRTLATEMEPGDRPWPVLYVLDHTCPDAAGMMVTRCEGARALSPDFRRELADALESYARTEFVDDFESVWPEGQGRGLRRRRGRGPRPRPHTGRGRGPDTRLRPARQALR